MTKGMHNGIPFSMYRAGEAMAFMEELREKEIVDRRRQAVRDELRRNNPQLDKGTPSKWGKKMNPVRHPLEVEMFSVVATIANSSTESFSSFIFCLDGIANDA